MEPRKTTQTDEPANGTAANEAADTNAGDANPQDRSAQYAQEASAAYERARRQMTDAVSRLRAEIDQLEMERTALKAQNWIRENAALATFLALGSGLLVGRLIAKTLTPAPPPPLPVRLRNRALEASRHAGRYAEDVGRAVKKGAVAAGGAAALAGGTLVHEAGEAGEAIAHRARALGGVVGHRAGDYSHVLADRLSGLGHDVVDRASAWNEVAGHRAHDAVTAFEDTAGDVAETVQKKASEGIDLAETAYQTVRAVVAAVLVKKVNDLVRRVF